MAAIGKYVPFQGKTNELASSTPLQNLSIDNKTSMTMNFAGLMGLALLTLATITIKSCENKSHNVSQNIKSNNVYKAK